MCIRDRSTARRCTLVATIQRAKNQAEPFAAKPPMRTPCGSCRSSAPDASWPSQITPPLPAVSWRTSRASSESMPKNRSSPKTTIHVLKPGRIARRGAANICTGKIPVIRPSRRSVVFTKSHPICLSCSCAPKICRRSARRISRQKRRTRRAQPAALAQHGVGSTHAKRHMFLSRFAHTLAVVG